MRIVDNTNCGEVTFGSLDYGQVYKNGGKIYMKTAPLMNRFENAVRLDDGVLVVVEDDTEVEVVDAWLTVE